MAANNDGLLGRLLTYFFVALLLIGLLKLAIWIVGAALGFGLWALFTLGPLLLVGWLVVKVIRRFDEPRR